jgi:hypothetical protein
VFWFSYRSDRDPNEQLETVFEHFVAPNAFWGPPLDHLGSSQWEHDWLATKDVNHTPPTHPPSGLRPDKG